MAKPNQATTSEVAPVVDTGSMLPAEFQAEVEKAYQEDISQGGFILPRIEIVHAAQSFRIPDDPEPRLVNRFRGVLIAEQRFNLYWDKSKGEAADEAAPPNCAAMDAINGSLPAETRTVTDAEGKTHIGVSVFGKCATCFYNRFGSSPTGKGKACANKVNLLVWPTEIPAAMPFIMTCASSSLKSAPGTALGVSLPACEIRSWMATQPKGKQVPMWGCVAEFSLEKQSAGSNVWSVVHAKVVGSVASGAMSMEDYRYFDQMAKERGSYLASAPTVEQETPGGYVEHEKAD